MATMASAPASPDPLPSARPQSMYATSPPEHVHRPRPHSFMMRPPRSSSRLSMASSRGGATRTSEDDTKTAVKVVVRVRPPLQPSDPGFDLIPQRFQRSTVQVPTPTSLSVESSQGRKIFTFDRVFGEDTTQKGVWDYLEDSVDSFLQGYNVSILAYGQSGAGKSYTMGTCGHDEQYDASTRGIIPRAAMHLFDALVGGSGPHSRTNSGLKTPTRYSVSNISSVLQNRAQNFDRNWQIVVTYVEIYNEQPRDLLLPEGSTVHERAAVQIREDPKGRIFVEGLRSVAVNTVEELMGVLNYGSAIRQTDATAINSRSSRSHAVFTINLKQLKTSASSSPARPRPAENGAVVENSVMIDSKLHFVDLAGSERLKNTGATGDRAKEGISINAGLASLGKVISQLSSRSAGGYVSYRDSKLTRMLQDSLGGNAITYMVACVTPAEFHLSETLNTVQYAQRARNIQSKPQIQQVSEDSDKQAVIERLRSEVAFLRQQIRSSDVGDKKIDTLRERSMTSELEMQNQLLDVQEGYRNLGERHAKLIAELTKSTELVQESATEGAAERLKRSRENQRQIESIILEYEKTIQSLEANLSTTRSSLANTESALLEKETKVAYIETMNQQLSSRIHKMMDRENSTESYLRDLEARLEDTTSGSEKHAALVAELRREMNRVRESETSAENYISTLEERLAEADQDMEIMQREVDRLEQLVDRQRSLGKLDSLLFELDQIQKKQAKAEQPSSDPETPQKAPTTNGVHTRQKSEPMEIIQETKEVEAKDEEVLPEEVDELQTPRPDPSTLKTAHPSSKFGNAVSMWQQHLNPEEPDELKPAQTRFMVDKFETVTQELFDLRLEHESTIYDFDMLSAKYQEALRTLAEMQDRFDDVQSSVTHSLAQSEFEEPQSAEQSFMADKQGRNVDRGSHSSPQSPSSELSSVGLSLPSAQPALSTNATKEIQSPDAPNEEVERLQALIVEHEKNMSDMQRRFTILHDEHKGTLDTVEKLKMEAQRSSSPLPGAGSYSSIRRHTSQIGSAVDRGQRSVASLRGIIAEELEDKPERIESAEIHLAAATHELSTRMSRIQSLEAELINAKREMDMKSTIISGLTRERNSLKTGSPVDLSMVSQMRDQLIQKETELKKLHEGYSKREQEMQAETSTARKQLEDVSATHEATKKELEQHKTQLNSNKSQLETALSTIETLRAEQLVRAKDQTKDADQPSAQAEANKSTESGTDSRLDEIAKLRSSLNKQITTNAAHAQKISELTQMHEDASKDIHEHSQIIQEKSAEIEKHKVQIAALQSRLQESESAVEFHKHGLKSLHEAHATEVEEMKLAHAGMLAGYDDQIAELKINHEKEATGNGEDLQSTKSTLQGILTGAKSALGHDTSEDMLVNHIRDLVEERKHVMETNKRLTSTNAELESQLADRQSLREIEEARDEALQKNANYQDTIRNLANEIGNHEDTIREKNSQIKRHEDQIKVLQAENEKKITLIEEIEQQLQRNYEQQQNRISVIQLQGTQALTEAQQKISQLERDLHGAFVIDSDVPRRVDRPQSPEEKGESSASHLRKSASIASIPSPPPAIPLPPLPILTNITSASGGNPSPPQSRHTSKELPQPQSPNTTMKDMALIKRQSAIIDDQDSRLRTIEKHLHAEKQLTATLEEALVDLEKQSNKLRVDAESWKKKAWALEEEMTQVRNDRHSERLSIHAVEEEIKKRRAAEDARAQLEERMKLLKQSMDGGKKKKKSTLNCF